MPPERHDFADGHALARAQARRVGTALAREIERHGRATLAVSGGTTPRLFFEALACEDLAWPRLTVTLVDERWVDESSPRSNARLVREALLQGPAGQATFVPLTTADRDPETGRDAVEQRIAALDRPFAVVVLGMGDDGHTASWFPGGDRLDQALDASGQRLVETMRAPAAGEPRITMTLPCVLDSRVLVLHIEGEDKRAALDAALGAGPAAAMPIRAALRQHRVPVEIYWCP